MKISDEMMLSCFLLADKCETKKTTTTTKQNKKIVRLTTGVWLMNVDSSPYEGRSGLGGARCDLSSISFTHNNKIISSYVYILLYYFSDTLELVSPTLMWTYREYFTNLCVL